MEFQYRNFVIFLLLLLSLSFPLSLSYTPFSPVDNHLVNCGSAEDATVDNRLYAADHSSRKLPFCSSDRSLAVRNEDPFAGSSSRLYDTARVFKKPSEYKFEIREKGTHMVRLHFYSLNSSKFDFSNAQFHVVVDKYVVLSNFNGGLSVKAPLVKEYLIWVDSDTLAIRFLPTESSKFAFVNAIEVISAPKDLVPNSALYLDSLQFENFDGWSNQALEVVYRVNVGGPKVTPFNDTLWRTWVPDDEYLESSSGSERLYFGGRIKYRSGGASREIGPDNVYKTARLIRSSNGSIPNVNITWVFPVAGGGGYKYLVRLHFCDIASISLELLFFNVYVNGNLAIENLDLSSVTNEMLASPYYADVVVDSYSSGVLKVSIGPSNESLSHAIDGILNGVEIMKLSNSMGSLDGPDSADVVLRHWPGRTGVLIPLVAAVLLVLSLSIVLRRRIIETKESIGWSKLPVNVSEFNAKV
ncbi:Malectin-like carbohydrate-binding domain containing protein [Trema orientale]|uniref:Malectin-like carbohydrate-binding domain containing protein n=1 Tax=Trema orientale TaxID=63057 RepID=A0A2P5FHQ8_TREOI|nr:Malectin-like carbohydrate-binding domain containing protein [Trema orientale]